MTDEWTFLDSPGWQAAYKASRHYAKTGQDIFGFWLPGGHMRWLSNDYPCEVEMMGDMYPTVEHGYLAARNFDNEMFIEMIQEESVQRARELSKRLAPGEHWNNKFATDTMSDLLQQKFMREDLALLLAATGQAQIIAVEVYRDNFFDVDAVYGEGQNLLGKMIMEKRSIVTDLLRLESGKIPDYLYAGCKVICKVCDKLLCDHPRARRWHLDLYRGCTGEWYSIQTERSIDEFSEMME